MKRASEKPRGRLSRVQPVYVSEAGQEQLRLWVDRCRRCLGPLEGERGPYCQRCDRQVFLESRR